METKEMAFRKLIKNGYSKAGDGKVWDIADMSMLYSTPEMAKGFLKLREHPRYRATVMDIEVGLLKKYSADFLKCVEDCKFNLIDMGCSDGMKAKALIGSLKKSMQFRYCPVSVSKHFVDLATENIKKENFGNIFRYSPRVSPSFIGMEHVGAALRNSEYQKNVFLLLGSVLGGFQINDYLFRLSSSMFPGDVLIIGNGIRKGERFVNLDSYKSSIFHQWFVHLLLELGFKEDEIEYDARFGNNRVEGFYKIKTEKVIESGRNQVHFKKGDEIVVATLYKYFEKELEDFCKMYFSEVKLIRDSEEEYALVFCKK
jgi:uncharacterized SAM-dependent methyltransferase